MTIISSDLVPVNAQTVNSVFLGVGQRIDVTIDASQTVSNYWLNVTFGGQGFCGGLQQPSSGRHPPPPPLPLRRRLRGLPTNLGTLPTDSQCLDNNNLTPVVTRSVPVANFNPAVGNTLPVTVDLSGTPSSSGR